jgi:hypothetical protein
MSPATPEAWNLMVLSLVQALLGAVSPNMRMVYLGRGESRWRLVFVLERDDAEDREEASDVATEFEALQARPIDYELQVIVSSDDLEWPDPPSRVVYRRRERDDLDGR